VQRVFFGTQSKINDVIILLRNKNGDFAQTEPLSDCSLKMIKVCPVFGTAELPGHSGLCQMTG
jgi:hypothetical protein